MVIENSTVVSSNSHSITGTESYGILWISHSETNGVFWDCALNSDYVCDNFGSFNRKAIWTKLNFYNIIYNPKMYFVGLEAVAGHALPEIH